MKPDNHKTARQELKSRLHSPPRTELPAGWRAGTLSRWFGKDKPWGSLEEAVGLCRAGELSGGRELLERIGRHDVDNFDAHVQLAFEYLHAPTDFSKCRKFLNRADLIRTNSCESRCLHALLGISGDPDFGTLVEHFCYVIGGEVPPVQSTCGNTLALMGYLAASDMYYQTRFRSRSDTFDEAMLNAAIIGLARLFMRQHLEAFDTFADGCESTRTLYEGYEKMFHTALTKDQRDEIADVQENFCKLGLALTLHSVGLDESAHEIASSLDILGMDSDIGRFLRGFSAELKGAR